MAVNWPTTISKPDVSTSLSYEPRVIANNFGDGYQAVIMDGINNMPRKMTYQYANINSADHQTLLNFWKATGPANAIVVPCIVEDPTGATTALFRIDPAPSVVPDAGGSLFNWTFPLTEVFGE